MTERKKRLTARRIRAYILLSLVIFSLFFFIYRWYKDYTSFDKTDDAFIDADRVSVSSKMLGRIAALYAIEGDSVAAGKLIVSIDSTDLVSRKAQAIAAKGQAEASLVQTVAKLKLDQKSISVQEVLVERAKEDLERAKIQQEGNVITRESYDHTRKAYETAIAQLEVVKAQSEVSRTMIESARRSVDLSLAQVNSIQSDLKNTSIFAPVSGKIAKRWLLPGDVVQPGQSVFTITRNDSIYLTAYFEETKIARLYIGKDVRFTVDAYPGVTFKGKINYIASNTAAQFSLIPPNNASGNFTKVTQRIPIRISVDSSDNNGKYPGMKLVSGMSVFIKIAR
jgi:membrane fusion protein, multidrug efflux system